MGFIIFLLLLIIVGALGTFGYFVWRELRQLNGLLAARLGVQSTVTHQVAPEIPYGWDRAPQEPAPGLQAQPMVADGAWAQGAGFGVRPIS